jgi:hypothetical protein
MLLTPGGSKSLANIGKLYGSDYADYEKITITKEQIEDMQSFLDQDYDSL